MAELVAGISYEIAPGPSLADYIRRRVEWEGAFMAAVLVVHTSSPVWDAHKPGRGRPLDMLITATLICHHALTDLHLRCYCLARA